MDQIIRPVQTGMDRFERRLESALGSEVEIVQRMARHLVSARGKRFRPALALLTAQALGGESDRVIDAAVGIELLQTATLIHDDIVDSADTRRGAPSLNAVWGNQVSVLMGDFLLARALQILVSLGSQKVMEAATRATQRMVEGELLEIEKGDGAITESIYLDLISKKTSALVSLSCELGAVLSGGSPEQIARLATFGELLGMAFQIIDDTLDFTGDSATRGKPVGNDVKEKTITLPLIRALANCSNGEGDRIRARIESGIEDGSDWQEIVAFVHRYDGIGYALETANRYATDASRHLSVLSTSEARRSLELAVRHAVERQR
jgi:octaprenyl-diphosphate synthase